MGIEATIRRLLNDDPAVTQIVAGRIDAAGRPAGALPNIVYQLLASRGTYSNDGPTGLRNARVQVSSYARDYTPAKELAAAVLAVLDGFRGTVLGPPAPVLVHSVFLDDERDAVAPPVDGQTRAAPAGVVMVFRVAYTG